MSELSNAFARKLENHESLKLKNERIQRDKRKVWEDVKRSFPDMAAFISNINSVFGRTAFTEIQVNGVVVVDTFPRRCSKDLSGTGQGAFVPDVLAHEKEKTGLLHSYWATEKV